MKTKIFSLVLISIFLFSFTKMQAQESKWKPLFKDLSDQIVKGKYSSADSKQEEFLGLSEKSFSDKDIKVIESYDLLAKLNNKLEKFQKSEEILKKGLSILEKNFPKDNLNKVKLMNNLSDVYIKTFKVKLAETSCNQALSEAQNNLGPDNIETGNALHNLAEFNLRRGNYLEGIEQVKKAIQIREKSLGKENADVGHSLLILAILNEKTGKFSEANNNYQKALKIKVKAFGNIHPEVATTLVNIANLNKTQKKYADAEKNYKQALKIREDAFGKDHANVAKCCLSLANLYIETAKYPFAESNDKKALEIFEKIDKNSMPVAAVLNSLGILYTQLGRYEDAIDAFNRSLEIRKSIFGNENISVAEVINNLAGVYELEGKDSNALEMVLNAIEIYNKTVGRNSPNIAKLINNLAIMYEKMGNLKKADSLYKESIDIKTKLFGEAHPSTAFSLGNLAGLYRTEGRFSESEKLFLKTLDIREKTFGKNHPDVTDSYLNLGILYEVMGKYNDAENYYEKALTNQFNQFENVFSFSSEKEQLAYQKKVSVSFPHYYSFVLKASKENPQIAQKLYNALLWQKGLVVSSISGMVSNVLNSGDKELISMLEELKTNKQNLIDLYTNTPENLEEHKKNIDALESKCENLEKVMMARSKKYGSEKQFQQTKWSDIANKLKDDEASVEIVAFQYFDKEWTDSICYVALVLTKKLTTGPALVFLGNEEKLVSSLVSYAISIDPDPLPASLRKGNRQYSFVWKPLEKYLTGINKVYLATDGGLNQISLGVFVDETGKFLSERYELKYVSSTKDILKGSENKNVANYSVLFGNPKFSVDTVTVTSTPGTRGTRGIGGTRGFKSAKKVDTRGIVAIDEESDESNTSAVTMRGFVRAYDLRSNPLFELPGTKVEVEEIDKVLTTKKWKIELYTQEKATEENVKNIKSSPRVLHFATHGFFLPPKEKDPKETEMNYKFEDKPLPINDNSMLRNGLFLSGANDMKPSTKGNDGILTAYEVANLNLKNTELVILSACETGLGDMVAGEGVFGLRRAFQIAGCEAVIMSNWSVPDQETEELMVEFYKRWMNGTDKYTAFYGAQNEMRKVVQSRYGKDIPFYWGAFIMVGK